MIKKEQDAFGKAIYDCLKTQNMYIHTINEMDDGYIGVAPRGGLYFSEFENWFKHEQKAIKYAFGKVLDIGCGAGKHLLYLMKKNFDVTGIDVSPYAIKTCNLRGVKKVYLKSVFQIKENDMYNTVLMMGNNFGLVENPAHSIKVFKKIHLLTKKNALIIAQSKNPYETNNKNHIKYQKSNKEKGKMPGQLKIRVRYQSMKNPWFEYLLASPAEMKKLLKNTGFYLIKIYKGRQGTYTAIIRKK